MNIIVGDLHGDWEVASRLVAQLNPENMIVCGDFGWWPGNKNWDIHKFYTGSTKVYFCAGNHENHPSLIALTKNCAPTEIHYNIFYMPHGSILTLNGQKIMFFGGADSIDKKCRIAGVSWFPEEIPSVAQFNRAYDYAGSVDIIVSHTCPNEFDVLAQEQKLSHFFGYSSKAEKINDPTRVMLSRLLEKFRPERWYFGHWHLDVWGRWNETNWRCLPDSRHPYQCWKELH